MRRRTAAPVIAALLLGAAACQKGDDTAAEVRAGAPGRVELASAVSAAQAEMPIPVSDSRVGVLLQDLCEGARGIGDQLRALAFASASEADAAVSALAAGTEVLCPGEVDATAQAAARAVAGEVTASTTVSDVSVGAEESGGNVAVGTAGRTSASSSSSASGGSSSSTNGGATNQSSGTATVGGGGASGSGNQSSTSFSQSVSDGGSSSSSAG